MAAKTMSSFKLPAQHLPTSPSTKTCPIQSFSWDRATQCVSGLPHLPAGDEDPAEAGRL